MTPGTVARQVPLPMGFPGKNTGVGGHFLLQGLFPSQGLNQCLLRWQAGSLPLSHQGSPCVLSDLQFIHPVFLSECLSCLCSESVYCSCKCVDIFPPTVFVLAPLVIPSDRTTKESNFAIYSSALFQRDISRMWILLFLFEKELLTLPGSFISVFWSHAN